MQSTSEAALSLNSSTRQGTASRQLMWLQLVEIKMERPHLVSLCSYSCNSVCSPQASYLSMQEFWSRGTREGERKAQLPNNRAPELPLAAKGQIPATSLVLCQMSGNWDETQKRSGLPGLLCPATFTHPEKGLKDGCGSRELPSAQLLRAARAPGLTATTDKHHQMQTLT